MRRLLQRLYWWLERRICPDLRYSQNHYHETLVRVAPLDCSWLELGCGHQMFASWMMKQERDLAGRASRLVGIDRDLEGLKKNASISHRIFGDIGCLPLTGQSFDLVTANMVVEHLGDPEAVLQEVHRVLRDDGLFVFHTPNRRALRVRISAMIPQKIKNILIRLLENRSEEDVFPTFYRMNTAKDITVHAKTNGFEIIEINRVSTNALTQMIPPVAILELAYIRKLEAKKYEDLRSNLIVVLQKSTRSLSR